MKRAHRVTGFVETTSIKIQKPVVDFIEHLLAEYYGFTEEELDFIINFDIKYRMGR